MDQISLTREGPIALVTLNRPDRNNAISLAMWHELASIFQNLDSKSDVRAIILTGAGKSFCAGADISEFGEVRASPEDLETYQCAVDDCIDAISGVGKPTIAAVSGYCLGGGCGLATACDFRLADKTARFGVPAAKLSIVYGPTETENLLALVGLSNAKRILFMAERQDADQGLRMGLVDEIDDDVLELAKQWGRAMARLAPLSINGAKKLLTALDKRKSGLDQTETKAMIRAASLSEDYAEGRLAFAEKRPPKFSGR